MLLFTGPNAFVPPKPPPLPPAAPPMPPKLPPLGGLVKGPFGGLLKDLGQELLFPPPAGLPPAQEKQAIDNFQPPGEDKGVEPPTPPPFQGGQVPGQLYLVQGTYEQVQEYWQGKRYTAIQPFSTYAIGPIVGFKSAEQPYGKVWYLDAAQKVWMFPGSPTIAYYHDGSVQSHQPSLQVVNFTIKTIIPINPPPGFKDQDPPSDNPGITSPGGSLGLGPINNGLSNPPNTNNAPGTNTPPNLAPLSAPGINFNPGTSAPPGTSPSPNPLTAPGINLSPGTSPFSPPGTTLLPPLFLPPGLAGNTGSITGFSPAPLQEPPSINTQPGPCQTSCSAPVIGKLNDQDKKLDNISDKLGAVNAGANAGQLAMLEEILARLGPKVSGGLSGFLGDKFAKLWNSQALDRALALANLAASIHNAAMLSRNIAETLVLAITNIMALIGIKDPEGTSKGFQEMVGNTIEAIIKGIIGAENYTNLTTTWAKANRIYQAAINVYQLLNDSMFAVAEGLELIGKYTGKIGNALKKSGEVLDNAYGWMSETFDFKSKKNRAIDRVIQGLQEAQEVSSDLLEITENFREAQENINEIGEQVNVIKTETLAQETEKNTKETESKNSSQTPDIPKSAMIQPSPPAT